VARKWVSVTELREALRRAREDLDIRVNERPPTTTAELECVAHLPDFGSPKGLIVFTPAQQAGGAASSAEKDGYAFSTLPSEYARYDRALYIDALEDWGWFGASSPPSWFKSRPHP
jgi:hypothetical protein